MGLKAQRRKKVDLKALHGKRAVGQETKSKKRVDQEKKVYRERRAVVQENKFKKGRKVEDQETKYKKS